MEIWYFLLYPLFVFAAVLFVCVRFEGIVVSEVQSVVDAITAQLVKVRDEIVKELEKVASDVHLAQADDAVDLSGLQAIVDALDAIVPDAAQEAEVEVEYEGLGEAEDEVAWEHRPAVEANEPVEDDEEV